MLMQAVGAVGAHFRSLLVFLEDPGAREFPSGHPGGLENGWVLRRVGVQSPLDLGAGDSSV